MGYLQILVSWKGGKVFVACDWADGSHAFAIGRGEFIKLQELTGTGPLVLYRRLLSPARSIQDISNIIRIGLVGGGLAAEKAQQLVHRYVEERPPDECLWIAVAILRFALVGDESWWSKGAVVDVPL